MSVVWIRDDWITPREVTETLSNKWAYTTIMTVLVRLNERGVLERRRNGQAFEYRSVGKREQFYADRIASVLSNSPDLEATLARFVEHLSPAQLDELMSQLDESSRRGLDDGA
jgi:predicted transcriptional regulator